MATPRLNQLSIDLSKLLNDEVGTATLNGEEFSASQRLLALNKAESGIISRAVVEQDLDTLEKAFNELLEDDVLVSGVSPSAVIITSAKTVRLTINGIHAFPVKFKDWGGIISGYNPEALQDYGSTTTYHWTEFGRKIHWFPAEPLATPPTAYYIKDHVDLQYNAGNDFLLPARFDPEILKSAFEFLTMILVKE